MWQRGAVALWLVTGCTGSEPPSSSAPGGPTWHQDVAPILSERCAGCHTDGGIAPMSLATYADAAPFAEAVANSVAIGQMPPFLAQETDDCQPLLPWRHDLRLTAEQKATLQAWADAGAPEGDSAHAAPIPAPPDTALEREDLVIGLPSPITVEGPGDLHTCLIVDPGQPDDRWVTGRQITAGNAAILHHVVSWIVLPGTNPDGSERTKAQLDAALRAEKGVGIGERYDCFGGVSFETVETEMLDAWAPGGVPNLAPPDSGQLLDHDALVLLDMHYHPTGLEPETDSGTTLSLTFADEPPAFISQVVLLGNFDGHYVDYYGVADLLAQPDESAPEFVIPAGASGHVEEMTWQWTLTPGFDLAVYGAGTHMHYVGRDMRVTLERAAPVAGEPAEECLIETPAWDFNWQRGYDYDADYADLPRMRNGDVVRLRCEYDNSASNPAVSAALAEQGLGAPVDVRLGEDTLDEMCLGAIAIVYPNFYAR